MRLKDVNALFMDTGLGREGYSIIGQGKIDEILSVRSTDRREVFEEAAGISRFRHRKEEAERKLARTEENLVRIGDKISELELQVEPLRVQSEKAKRFLRLRDELRVLEISLWIEQLEKIRINSVKVHADFEQAVRQRDEANKALEALYAAAEDYGGQMRACDLEADRARLQSASLEADANERKNTISLLKSQMEHNAENAARLRQEIASQSGRADSIGEQTAARQARLEELSAKIAACEVNIAAREADRMEAEASASVLGGELERLRERAALESDSAGEARQLLSALAASAQELMDQDESGRRALHTAEARLGELNSLRDQTAQAFAKAEEERGKLENILSGYAMRLQSRQKRAKDAGDAHMALQMEEGALSARIHMLTEMEKLYEGYSKAVKLVMGEAARGALPGIHGPVAGLVRVPDRYAVAVEIALGGAMQHLVVTDEDAGKAAIQYLKRRDGGRGTFLPLTSIRPNELREQGLEREAGFVGIASQLVEYDGRYAAVFASLLGRTVVAEDLDQAVAMARRRGHRFRIVTLDGQVVNPGGSMTGGSASRSAGILSRANELERLRAQAEGLNASLEAAAQAMEEARREAAAAAYELETAQGQRREAEDTLLTLSGRLESQETQIAEVTDRIAELRQRLSGLEARTIQVEGETAAARRRIEALEGSAAALLAEAEGKREGRQTLRDSQEELAQAISQLRVERAALEAEGATQAQALEALEALRRDIVGDQSQQEGLITGYEDQNKALVVQVAEHERALEALIADREQAAAAIENINRDKLALEAKRNRADRESREKNAELLTMEREVSVLEQKKAAAAMEETQILDRLWETYELSHEAARAQRVELESIARAARRIAELKRSISGLGNINLDAIDEFQRVNERYTYLTSQRDDVETSKGELERIIEEITREMRVIFAREFEQINRAFGGTFLDLFGGGKASLELEDKEDILNCGIEIKVQPPGKALKTLSLLSGGEKAFVAIALYFAILKVRPTPFCVMDEIEATLDDANVVRFIQYLRTMTDKTQFIIITHRRGTMEEADVLYGVTMQEQGVSRMLTINLNDAERELNLQ